MKAQIIERDGEYYAVIPQEDGATIYALDPEAATAHVNLVSDERRSVAYANAALDSYLNRTVKVGEKLYSVHSDGRYVQIKLNGEFFTEADWEGDISDAEVAYLVVGQLEDTEETVAADAFDAAEEAEDEARETENATVICKVCGGAGFIEGVEGNCTECGGYQLVTPAEAVRLHQELARGGNRVVIVESRFWSCSQVGWTYFASSPGYPGVEFELEFTDGGNPSDELLVSYIEEELEARA